MMEKLDHGQCCKRNLKRMDVWEEASVTTGLQQQHKELRPKRVIMSGKQENTERDLQADHRAGDHKAKLH
jgi:hypothetical protein